MSNLKAASLVPAVIEFAEKSENYENGWDIIVEAFSESELIEAMGWATTVAGAIKKLKLIVADHQEQAGNCW